MSSTTTKEETGDGDFLLTFLQDESTRANDPVVLHANYKYAPYPKIAESPIQKAGIK